jgi:RNA polymerase sigma-B factor
VVADELDANGAGELFEQYRRTGDRRVRNEIVDLHVHVADFYAKRYTGRGVPAEDLRQVALLAILRAVDRFDPDRGVLFSTFASRTVDGEFKRHFRDKTWTVRPPRRSQELHLAVRRAQDGLAQRLGRSPTVQELAREVGASVDHVLEAMEAGLAHHATSLDSDPSGDDSSTGGGLERFVATHDPGFARVDREMVLRQLIENLDGRVRRIIELRFFENRTQDEIADEMGISQSYLSRILRRVLLDLRSQLIDQDESLPDLNDLTVGP